MEQFTLDNDIPVICLQATSFPEGIGASHHQLHRLVAPNEQRRSYGLSRPEEPEGPIVYRAAAEELFPGEAEQLGLETHVIRKGNYASRRIEHYMNNPTSIGTTFQELLQEPNLDPEGYCVEWYISDEEMRCMVRMRD